jgi:hypothetical protein
MPSGIPKGKTKLTNEERKAKAKTYNARPEAKAKRKEYSQRPEVKAKRKEYSQKPEIKAKRKEYRSSPKVKARRKKIRDRPENLASEKNKRNNLRLEVLKYYSKSLSKSDIPCCRCCGKNTHFDFLTIDHIAGKKQMDSEPELVELGYSSKKDGERLTKWIIKNNFPKGFQILCHSCNMAKSFPENNNKCPHERK